MRRRLACLRKHIAEWLQQRARTGSQVALQMESNVELQRASVHEEGKHRSLLVRQLLVPAASRHVQQLRVPRHLADLLHLKTATR